MAIEAVKCGRMKHSQTMNRKQVSSLSHFVFHICANYFSPNVFYFSSLDCCSTPAGYRNNLSIFDIFYQIHFFPVQKLLIDLLLLSLSIALAAGGKQGSACKKFVSYLNLINLFYKIKLLQIKAFFRPDLS